MSNAAKTKRLFKQTMHKAEMLLAAIPLHGRIDLTALMDAKSYGSFNDFQKKAVTEAVKSHVVYDLGAGSFHLSNMLLEFGASKVIAIEKESVFEPPRKKTPKLEILRYSYSHFLELHPKFKAPAGAIAFISWPANHKMDGLIELSRKFSTVIYLGKNTDGTACGWPGFFEDMLNRPIKVCIPDRKNTLIIYGKRKLGTASKPRCQEEFSGMNFEDIITFKEGA